MTLQSNNQNTLESLCSLIVNTIHPKNVDGSSYIGLEHISSGKIFSDTSGYAEDVQSHKYFFQKNDVLYSKLRPYLDKAILATRDGICTTELLVLRPHKGVSSLFLVCMLHDKNFIEYAMEGVTGVQHPRTSWAHIKNYKIEKFSIEVYHKIGLLGATVQHALSFNEGLLNLAKKFKHATMHKLFTCGLRGEAQKEKETEIGLVPNGWKIVSLSSLGKIGNGSTPKKTINEYWEQGYFPWLTSSKVYDRDIVSAEQFVSKIALEECHLPIIKPGAILIAITGQGKTLGHCAVLNIEATINQHLAYIQVDLIKAIPSFVRGYLETQYEYLRQVASAGGSTKGALTCAFLSSLAIPLPDMEEQQEIVDILDVIDRKIDLHRRKKALLEELFKSLLHKLMTGEIRVDELDLSALEALQQPRGTA